MTEIILTKSDFLDYQHCAKSLWLKKHKPNAVSWPAPNLFDRMLMQDGYRVEAIVKELIADWPDVEACAFQSVFQSSDGLYARADLVRTHADGEIDLFEIKASTSLRSSTGSDHVDDATFQTLVSERAGHQVRAIHVIHVNKDYVRSGKVNPTELLTIVDVTEDVRTRLANIEDHVDAALEWISQDTIDENGCSCLLIGNRANQCASFDYFNPDVPDRSVYLLPRISKQKLQTFVDERRLDLADINVSEVSKLQAPVLIAAQSGRPVINKDRIQEFLDSLQWPLYFYDYETFASAIPIADGLKPQQQMPVQYSLHRLSKDGELTHSEFLSDRPGMQHDLVENLSCDIGPIGNLISWNKKFEMTCNKAMAELLPEHSAFLTDLNERTADLMDVFKEDYVDIAFKGSTSIKKVLPVVCPHLHYSEDAVHDGAGAMAAWLEMIEKIDRAEKDRLGAELRSYCELDTLAMVEIYRFLRDVIAGQ